ncbi:sensor histidine kinase [Thermus caliditerrae]|uniref:sensor histidine kinase n=1 Tax=Thermus caliditerrae TaxID=1330700 RepID=UPI001F1920EB|nr:HAMP domain-containing sensor histidine kinase [Thermus caliditerrae]
MSLRIRLAYTFFLLTFASGLLSLAGGYLVFRNLVERDIAQDLAELSGRVGRALVLTQEGPRLAEGDIFLGTHYVFGFRLLQGERPVLEGGFAPEASGTWRTLSTSWQGYNLEVSLRVEEYQRALSAFLRAGLSLLLPLLFLAALLGYATAGFITRPLERLSQAVESLSALRFPEPLPLERDRELARLTRGFNRLVEAVRSALERERLFTRYASHELRIPLAVFRAQLDAARQGLIPWEEALPHMEGALRRMEAVLQGLLALARPEEGNLAPMELAEYLEASLKDKGVRLLLQGPAWVLAHPLLVDRLVDNLLANAFRHGAPPVEVRLFPNGDSVVLEVRDHGKGVREEDKERLTRPFFRGPGGPEGLGLGLALVEQVVHRLGGTLEFANAHPGLRVRVRLPRREDAAA